jgi:hypothetical protein
MRTKCASSSPGTTALRVLGGVVLEVLSIASMNCELDVNLIFELLLVALFLGHLSSEDVDHSSFG